MVLRRGRRPGGPGADGLGIPGHHPRSSVRAATRYHGRVYGWGAHGWRGQWLVNGSSQGLVDVSIEPPARARTLGYPVKLRLLRVSVTESEALIAALS